ncbi:MAG: hypothetical protein JO257_02735 [Deltaproteobacteria bacterium]|nr:hypothetical protein [Deltaproteobacteria bacterium]
MKKALLLALLLATSAHAAGTPPTISFVARLADNGTPITGAHDLVLSLFDASTGGNPVWTESRSGVTIPSDGVLYLDLGSVTPLDANVFSGNKKYLEVTIDAQITTPRIVIESTPYAIRSGEASHAVDSDTLGTHPASFYQARVSNACSSGSAIASIDAAGSVMCQAVPTYLAGAGLTLTGSTFSVDTTLTQARVSGVCASGAIETITATGAVTCLTAGTGLAFTTNQFVVDFTTTQHAIVPCTAGSLLSSADSSGTATCYSAGFGIQFNAGTKAWDVNTANVQRRVTGTCAVGQAISAIAQDGTVTCGGSTVFSASTAGGQQTNSQSYGNAGPSVSANVASGHALVTITGAIQPTNGNGAFMGLSIDSAAATDAQSLNADTNPLQSSATYFVTVTPGSHTFAIEYRVNGGGNATFTNRSIIVQAVP